jgi:pfkB family carbohydrate kinase
MIAASFRTMKSPRSIQPRPSALFVGLAAIDISYTVDEVPRRNQKISVAEQLITAGGPATNAAATFAFLGGRATLVSAVGAHPMSSVIRDDLSRFGIRLHDQRQKRGVGECDGVLSHQRGVQSAMVVGCFDCLGRWSVHGAVHCCCAGGDGPWHSGGAG